jgi:hypothetical protein
MVESYELCDLTHDGNQWRRPAETMWPFGFHRSEEFLG